MEADLNLAQAWYLDDVQDTLTPLCPTTYTHLNGRCIERKSSCAAFYEH